MGPKNKQEATESTKKGIPQLKKRTGGRREQNVRTVSTAGELFKGATSSAEKSMTKKMHVDAMLLRFLVENGGSTKEKIEKDFKVELKVPSTNEGRTSKCELIITGTEARIEAAQRQIKAIVDEAVKGKLQDTHFISLPLAIHPDLLEQVEKFQERILARNQPTILTSARGSLALHNCSAKVIPHKSGIDKSIFVNPRTFHLTVLMLKLWNEERVQRAAEVLEKTQAAIHEALEGRPVVLDFKGVETMRGKPDNAHVLYARVQDTADKARLLQACQVLIDAYVESGLVMEKDIGQALKLHATLMNTSYRTVKNNHRIGKRIPFDATEILEQYGEWKWGEFAIPEAQLSQRFV